MSSPGILFHRGRGGLEEPCFRECRGSRHQEMISDGRWGCQTACAPVPSWPTPSDGLNGPPSGDLSVVLSRQTLAPVQPTGQAGHKRSPGRWIGALRQELSELGRRAADQRNAVAAAQRIELHVGQPGQRAPVLVPVVAGERHRPAQPPAIAEERVPGEDIGCRYKPPDISTGGNVRFRVIGP